MLKSVDNIVNDITHVVRHIFLYFYLRHLLLKRHETLHRIVEVVLYQFIFILLLFNFRNLQNKRYFAFVLTSQSI